jgi:hypothetical protein
MKIFLTTASLGDFGKKNTENKQRKNEHLKIKK